MLIDYKLGTTSVILRVKLRNSSVTTGAGLTGLTNASSGLIISTIANNEATATAYTVAASNVETITTLGTYAAPTSGKCRFKEVDATNHPGIYEIQIANARFAVSNARHLLVSITGATNLVQTDVLVPLRGVDPYDGVRFGMTALPNAAAGASGGLPTGDASARVQVQYGTSTGQINLTAGNLAGAVPSVTGNVGGNVVGSVGGVLDPVIVEPTTLLSTLGLASGNLDTQLSAIDDFLDTEIAAIKAKTDLLPSAWPANLADLAITATTGYVTVDPATALEGTELADAILGRGRAALETAGTVTPEDGSLYMLIGSIRNASLLALAGHLRIYESDNSTIFVDIPVTTTADPDGVTSLG